MKVLLLGPERPEFEACFRSGGDTVVRHDDKISLPWAQVCGAKWLVSYGYRHILPQEVLDWFPRRAVNLHISYLPWNRGADPNLWSILDDSPAGVSIHLLDAGLDTGDLIAQRLVPFDPQDTLRSSYARLNAEIQALFWAVWPQLKGVGIRGIPQPSGGSCHRVRDRAGFEHLLRLGWDTPVSELIGRAKRETP